MSKLKEFWHKSQDDLIFMHSTALAYTTLASLVPLLAVAFFLFKFFGGFDRLLVRMQPFIEENLAPAFSDKISGFIEGIIYNVNSKAIGIIGVLGFLFTTLATLTTIEKTLNLIWGIKKHRSYGKRIVLYLMFLFIGPILLTASILFGSQALTRFIPYMTSSLLFSAMFFAIPNTRVPIKNAVKAGVVTGIVFEIAKLFYSYYAKRTIDADVIYGAMIVMPLFLLWLYVTWLIILFGAEYCHYLQKSKSNGVFGFFPK